MMVGLILLTIPVEHFINSTYYKVSLSSVGINMVAYFSSILFMYFTLLWTENDVIKLTPIHTTFILAPIFILEITMILFLYYSIAQGLSSFGIVKLPTLTKDSIDKNIWMYNFIMAIYFVYRVLIYKVDYKELLTLRNLSLISITVAFLTVLETKMTNSPYNIFETLILKYGESNFIYVLEFIGILLLYMIFFKVTSRK
ncbi:hypothetical protein [Candidatus Sulfurimonas baltica]|uniref:Uncharacterized protein n=1 Tax=Candidatus Sulfurimonas baltica TaxID=2740404 RepID=A0A7S7LVW8_9BACT|nr:hypothetical protein [Candidatus Sulfurimonas baltica]QOY52494.1 hypothetical protein HUE88_02010 [Candidatus Sulfurimonas baltica]